MNESGQVRPGPLSQLWCPLRYVGRGDHGDDLELDEIAPARGPLMECVTDVDRVALRVLAAACHDGEMQEIGIRGDMIRLAQLLKLSALAESGADARELLLAKAVAVNGEPEARRGRQLHRGDVVAVGEQAVRVV